MAPAFEEKCRTLLHMLDNRPTDTRVEDSPLKRRTSTYTRKDQPPHPRSLSGNIPFSNAPLQVGFGPVTWLILSEVFPLKIRSAAVSVGTLANFGSNFLVALLFDLERTNLGEGLLFGQFALIALAAVAFINAQVPETRGLTLEEIEAQIMGDAEADAESQS